MFARRMRFHAYPLPEALRADIRVFYRLAAASNDNAAKCDTGAAATETKIDASLKTNRLLKNDRKVINIIDLRYILLSFHVTIS